MSEITMSTNEKETKKRKIKVIDIFVPIVCEEMIDLDIKYVTQNIKEILRSKLSEKFENSCCTNGYVKPDSLTVQNYSAGIISNDSILFTCTIEMLVCLPVEGMVIECQVQNITKAGIRAEVNKYNPSPLVIFIARDHHFQNAYFNSINENDIIHIKVIGSRFELNDKYISVIAEIIVPKEFNENSLQPKISIENNSDENIEESIEEN